MLIEYLKITSRFDSVIESARFAYDSIYKFVVRLPPYDLGF